MCAAGPGGALQLPMQRKCNLGNDFLEANLHRGTRRRVLALCAVPLCVCGQVHINHWVRVGVCPLLPACDVPYHLHMWLLRGRVHNLVTPCSCGGCLVRLLTTQDDVLAIQRSAGLCLQALKPIPLGSALF